MKEIEKFAEEVAAQIRDYLPSTFNTAKVEVAKVRKGRKLCTQLSVFKNAEDSTSVALSIPLDAYYSNISPTDAAIKIAKIILDCDGETDRMNSVIKILTDYKSVQSKLYIRLYSTEPAIASDLPYQTVADDLAAVCYVDLGNEPEMGYTVNVTDAMLKKWNKNFGAIFADAQANMAGCFTYDSMYEILKSLAGKMFSEDIAGEIFDDAKSAPWRILSKKDKVLGAGMLAVPAVLEKVFGDTPHLILPSSIHEVIAMPVGIITPNEAKDMVMEVNAEKVAPEEQLSDSVYLYKDGKIIKYI